MTDAFIYDAVRTPRGKGKKDGSLHQVTPIHLVANCLWALRDRNDLLVVAGLGAPNWDISAAGDSPNNFPLWGAMGAAAMLGFGLAIAQPERRVLVITGDGEMLMSVGALATIAVQNPPNLTIAVLDNERFGETGMQKTHTAAGVDLGATAGGIRGRDRERCGPSDRQARAKARGPHRCGCPGSWRHGQPAAGWGPLQARPSRSRAGGDRPQCHAGGGRGRSWGAQGRVRGN